MSKNDHKADQAAKKSAALTERIEANPLAIMAGGLALGALVGALLPRTQKETQLLGKTGRQINDRARQAFSAAREAGGEKVKELSSSTDILKSQVKDLLSKSGEAAKAAASAAQDATRTPRAED